jgi:hypothetical protein
VLGTGEASRLGTSDNSDSDITINNKDKWVKFTKKQKKKEKILDCGRKSKHFTGSRSTIQKSNPKIPPQKKPPKIRGINTIEIIPGRPGLGKPRPVPA